MADEHQHNWRHLGGARFGMYRCSGCQCFGYSKVYRGMHTHQFIVPYKCYKCKAWAVAKEVPEKQRWRHAPPSYWVCAKHRSKGAKK